MMQTAINNNMEKSITMKSIVIQAYVWLALPLLIFLAFWVIPWISVPAITAIILILAKIFREKSDSQLYKSRGFAASLRFDRNIWWIILVILLVSIYCGIGGLYAQNYTDAFGRNAIFYDLVKLPWPTEYSPIDGNARTLVYYFGFWLPAAGVAKICGQSIFVGDMAQLAYAVWGIWLITAFLFSYCRGRRRWLALLLLFFFAGWEIVENHFMLHHNLGNYPFIEFFLCAADTANYFALNTMHPILTMIYNQGIAAFLGITLIYYQRRCFHTLIFTFSLLMIFAPIPAFGILPICIVWGLMHFRKSLSFPNILGVLICVLIASFYMGSPVGAEIDLAEIHDTHSLVFMAKCCILFIVTCIAVYIPFIWRSVKNSYLFWALLAIACAAPFFTLTGRIDFGWRIPTGLAVFMLFTVTKTAVNVKKWNTPKNVCFAAVLAIGALSPIIAYAKRTYFEINDVIIDGKSPKFDDYNGYLSIKHYITPKNSRNPGEDAFLQRVLYTTYVCEKETFFYRHFQRRSENENPGTNNKPKQSNEAAGTQQ